MGLYRFMINMHPRQEKNNLFRKVQLFAFWHTDRMPRQIQMKIPALYANKNKSYGQMITECFPFSDCNCNGFKIAHIRAIGFFHMCLQCISSELTQNTAFA